MSVGKFVLMIIVSGGRVLTSTRIRTPWAFEVISRLQLIMHPSVSGFCRRLGNTLVLIISDEMVLGYFASLGLHVVGCLYPVSL